MEKIKKFGNKVVELKDKVVPVAKVAGLLVGTYVAAIVVSIGVGTVLGSLLNGSGTDDEIEEIKA